MMRRRRRRRRRPTTTTMMILMMMMITDDGMESPLVSDDLKGPETTYDSFCKTCVLKSEH